MIVPEHNRNKFTHLIASGMKSCHKNQKSPLEN